MLAHLKLKKIFENINKDVKQYVIANIGFNLLKVIIIFLIMFEVCALISTYINVVLGSSLIFVSTLAMSFVLFTRLACIGITNDELYILHLKTLKLEEKQIYKVPIGKIRNITVRKMLFTVSLKISFISEEGKLEKMKYKFTTFAIGKNEVRDFANIVYKKLVDIQKIIDKGDF